MAERQVVERRFGLAGHLPATLREIAERTVSPEDLTEDLIHSLQKYVEVDEPEPEAPAIEAEAAPAPAEADLAFDRMSEEELLRGLESLDPPERRDD